MNRLLNILIYFFLSIGTTSQAQTKDSTSTLTCIPKTDTLDNQKVYNIPDQMPEYPGGQTKLIKYIFDNLKYPSNGEDWYGSIYITFIIDTTGNVRNACILKRDKYIMELNEIEKDALRIINEMPSWTPGYNHGEKVYARVNFPIKFGMK